MFSYPLSFDSSSCNVCHLGKQCKLSFNESSSYSNKPFFLVHSNVWQASCKSISGFSYYALFLDDFTKFSWIYLLHHKHEVYAKFLEFHAMIRNLFNCSISYFQSDGGGEFTSNQFEQYLCNHGIQNRISCPHTPQQNGAAERKHRHLANITGCLLFQSQLPPEYWAEAMHYAVYLSNRLPSKVL